MDYNKKQIAEWVLACVFLLIISFLSGAIYQTKQMVFQEQCQERIEEAKNSASIIQRGLAYKYCQLMCREQEWPKICEDACLRGGELVE